MLGTAGRWALLVLAISNMWSKLANVSTADQLLSARISGICRRRCARGKIDDLDAAVAELRELAGHRPDLLAEHAGVCLGIATAPGRDPPPDRGGSEAVRWAEHAAGERWRTAETLARRLSRFNQDA